MTRVGKVIRVEWFDAWFDEDIHKQDFKDEYICTTYGLCIRDGDVISVAHQLQPENDKLTAVTHIPRAYVKRVEVFTTK